MLQVTGSLAVRVYTTVVFSGIDLSLFKPVVVPPTPSAGPVITGGVVSPPLWAVKVTVVVLVAVVPLMLNPMLAVTAFVELVKTTV